MAFHAKAAFAAALCAVAVFACSGCRREDPRTYAFSVPGLTEGNAAKARAAVAAYDGVDAGSIAFDFAAKTMTLKYDSMKVARTNIRMALEAAGIKADFPAKKPGSPAGYIDTRD